jgi:hypothetical protein
MKHTTRKASPYRFHLSFPAFIGFEFSKFPDLNAEAEISVTTTVSDDAQTTSYIKAA